MLTKKQEIHYGVFLSKVLRHRPQILGLTLDEQGWTGIETLLEKMKSKGKRISREDLQQIVDNNNKSRYSISEDGSRIRANQGHSIQVELDYIAQEPPEFLYHGTAERFIDSILKTGLNKRKRHHVHLSLDKDTAVQVGNRHGKVVILQVKAAEMHKAGFEFYCTPNAVWLTDHVPVKYLLS